MKSLVFVTNNKHKIEEIQFLAQNKLNIISLKDVKFYEQIPENKPSIEENALFKAQYFYNKTGLNCFADDTGLEVFALNGLPGVKSARFVSDHDCLKNLQHVLKLMQGKKDRKARFRTVIALIIENKEYIFEGIVNGYITTEPLGNNGFGYDSIFIPEGDNRTFAQMSLKEKSKYSHRQRAFTKLINFLSNHFS